MSYENKNSDGYNIVDYENDTILDPLDYYVDFNYIYDKDQMYIDRLGFRQIIPLQSEQQTLVSTNGILLGTSLPSECFFINLLTILSSKE